MQGGFFIGDGIYCCSWLGRPPGHLDPRPSSRAAGDSAEEARWPAPRWSGCRHGSTLCRQGFQPREPVLDQLRLGLHGAQVLLIPLALQGERHHLRGHEASCPT